jgi:hypothetical protein
MTVAEYVARQTERMAEALAHFVGTTPEDRQVWHPALEGSAPTRSILEQVAECVVVNLLIAAVLRGGDLPSPGSPMPTVHFASGQEAQEQLISSARELSAAISAMTEEDMTRLYEHPRGPMSGQNLILSCYRNMAYHAGQANLIQILYGDTEFHVPPNWR